MKFNMLAAALIALAGTSALAQTASTSGETPAVATPGSQNPAAPVAGANSFTEDQVKDRLQEAGFANVSKLKLGDDGVWRGMATKSDKQTNVALDYQGNITSQ